MTTKEHIENLLDALKERGVDREKIEKDLGYSPNYVRQILAKGGTDIFLRKLQKYSLQIVTEKKQAGAWAKMNRPLILFELWLT